MLRVGIDLGGTKIEAIGLHGSQEIVRLRIDTPRDDYEATLDAIGSAVAVVEQRVGTRGTVGVGIPGTLSAATGLVKNANSVWLIGKPLRQDLRSRLGRDVRIANDANCFAVSEAADGAAAGADVVFAAIIGTGTGAGIVVRGEVLVGPQAIAGEWGHNALPWAADDERPGPACYCGLNGCIETFLSGPGMSRDHARHTGHDASPPEIEAAAAGGDRSAEATLQRYESRLARGLASIINVLDPDVIVLGGGMSNIERLYERVPSLWARHVFGAAHEPVRTRLVRARHGDASGVRGAAWLWPAHDTGTHSS
jgi:fructokinase